MKTKSESLPEDERQSTKAEDNLKALPLSSGDNSMELSNAIKLIHELQLNKLDLEIQNRELKHAVINAEAQAEELSLLYHFLPGLHLTLSDDGIILGINEEGIKMIGGERGNLIESSFMQFIPNEMQPVFNDFLQKVFETKLKQTCEISLFFDEGTITYFHFEGIAGKNTRKCFVIAVDITERKRMDEALRFSESKFKKAFNQHPCIMGISDLETGEYLEVNQTFYDVLGYTPEEVIGKRATDLFPDYNNLRAGLIEQLKATGHLHFIETTIHKKDGSELAISFSAEIIEVENKRLMFTTVYDLTERIQTARKINQIRENYESFFGSIEEFLFVVDEQWKIVHTNRYMVDRLEYTSEELLGMNVLLLHPEDRREEAQQTMTDLVMGNADYCLIPMISKSNKLIPVEIKISSGLWDGKKAIFGISKDISQILLSEEKFSKVFFLNPSICTLNNIKTGHFLEVNDAFVKISGYSREEVIGKNAVELGLFDSETNILINSLTSSDGKLSNLEVKLKTKINETKFVLLSSETVNIQGENYTFSTAIDITYRKSIEKKLRNSEQKFKALSDASFEAIVILEEGICINLNTTAEKIFGYTRDEAIGLKLLELVIPGFNQDFLNNLISGHEIFELPVKRKDDTFFQAELQARLINDGGQLVQVIAIRDISQRKHVENALLESELRLRQLAEQSRTVVWEVDKNGLYTYASQNILNATGYHPEELVGKMHFYDLQPEDERESVKSSVLGIFKQKLPIDGLEFLSTTRNGEKKWASVYGFPVLDLDGNLLGYKGSTTDITERKHIQMALNESEARYARLAELSQTITWEIDSNGLYTYVSPVVEMVFGYKPEELIGKKHYYDLHPEEEQETFKAITFKIINRKEAFQNFENQAWDRNGNIVWVSTNGIPVLNQDGTLAGYQGSDRNITGKKLMEMALVRNMDEINSYQQRLKSLNASLIEAEENERNKLAGFLHDGLGQTLSIAYLKLTALHDVHHQGNFEKNINDACELIQKSIKQCRTITYELNPPLLFEHGLTQAIEWKLKEVSKTTGLKVSVTQNSSFEELNNKFRFFYYIALSELIQNVVKHARATEISVDLNKGSNAYRFSVKDNGVGFIYNPGSDLSDKYSFGLFSINERLNAIEGSLSVVSFPGQGALVSIEIPF